MKRIRILVTSDVHGNVFPSSSESGSLQSGSFARISTAVSSLRDETTILLDNGDALNGNPLSFFHNMRYPDDLSPVTRAMNDIEYDYVNVGNHDFDGGEEVLMMHLQNLKAPCITSNWIYHGKPYGPTYVIREISGVKIALFGLVTPAVGKMEKKSRIRHSRFADAVESARRTVSTIQRLEKPDYIICMYHGGFEKDPVTGANADGIERENEAYRLCREIGGIDVLISGHQHRSMSGTLFNTVYLQTAANGREIGCIDLFPDSRRSETRLLQCDMPADEDLLHHVEKEHDECEKWLDTPAAVSDTDLTLPSDPYGRIRRPAALSFFSHLIMDYTHADLVSGWLPLHAEGPSRNITMRDLLALYPYSDSIVLKKISGAQLRSYLEKSAEMLTVREDGKPGYSTSYLRPDQAASRYDMITGAEYEIRLNAEAGRRITSLKVKGEDVTDDMEFTIALSGYRAAGGGDYALLAALPTVRVYSDSIAEMLMELLYGKGTVHPQEDPGITLIF